MLAGCAEAAGGRVVAKAFVGCAAIGSRDVGEVFGCYVVVSALREIRSDSEATVAFI